MILTIERLVRTLKKTKELTNYLDKLTVKNRKQRLLLAKLVTQAIELELLLDTLKKEMINEDSI